MKRFLLMVSLGLAVIVAPTQAQQKFNPNQVAVLRWYPANQTATFNLPSFVTAVAFDGVNVWVLVVSGGSGSVVQGLRASDGAPAGSFPVGNASTFLTGIA